MRNIVFIGFMGAGKSSIGKLLAEKLSFSFIDTDILIEKKMKMSIPKIFKKYGEAHFRRCENEAVKEAAERSNIVISTGGGVPMFETNMQVLRENSIIICLRANVETIMYRTRGRGHRPLLDSQKEKIQELLDKRKPFYEKADFFVDTDDLSPIQIVGEIMAYLRRIKG